MSKRLIFTGMMVGASVLFVGCGGGSSSNEVTAPGTGTNPGTGTPPVAKGKAFYVDSAVSGVNYKCGSTEGITGATGEFTFEVGGSCTFYLGDITLRGVDAALLKDGEKVYETDTKIARILQSLDSDGNPDNGITVSETAVQALADAGITKLPETIDELNEMLEVIENNGGTAVSAEDTQAHMLRTLLAGNTLYTTIWDDVGTMESWSFNAALSSVTWTELVGGSATGTGSLVIDGRTMTFTCTSDSEQECETEPTIIEVKEVLTDYVVVEVTGGELGSQPETLRLYFDEAKARAYLLAGPSTPAPDLTTLLAGKTLYTTVGDQTGTLESWAFNDTFSSVTWKELVGGTGDTDVATISNINGLSFTVTDSDSSANIAITEQNDDYLVITVMQDGEEESIRLYFDEAKARAAFGV